MKKHLYFICPTDFLEPVIRNSFESEHYFLSSLGISMAFDERNLRHIKDTLEIHEIRELSFILADDNRFFRDALEEQKYSDLNILKSFYEQMREEKDNCQDLWQSYNRQFLILSRYLNNRIKSLQYALEETCMYRLNIDAKIYKRQEGMFYSIYPALIFREGVSLN